MFPFLYVFGFVASALLLSIWFYRQRRDGGSFFPFLLVLSLGAFIIGVLSSEISFDEKLLVLFRDLLVLGVVGLFSQLFLKRLPWFLLGLMLLVIGLRFYYSGFMATALVAEDPAAVESNWSPDGELLIEMQEGTDINELKDILAEHQVTAERAFYPRRADETELDDYYVLNVPDDHPRIKELQEALTETGLVDWIEGNETVRVEPMPARRLPEVNRKFGLDDPGLEHLWSFEVMNMDQLFDLLESKAVQPAKTAMIAILDTGVDAKHEDLSDNFVSIDKKYDNDPRGHGTHCAGIAGAVSNNGKGVASYSRDNGYVKLTSIKVLSASGMGTQQTIIKGIILAADKGADVISLSLGGYSSQAKQRAYEKAIDYARKAGAIVVAAAGNANRNAKNFSPVNARGVIGVSALNEDLSRASFSNWVQDIEMGVAAPGTNIYSTIPGDKYAALNGTSMATPYVSGLVGLMKSIRPDLSAKQAYRILKDTGQPTTSGDETGPLIQPERAIARLLQEN